MTREKVITSVGAGNYHNLALCGDGTVVAWGLNLSGQLGNNSTTDSSLPVTITASGTLNGRTAVTVAAGSDHSLVLCLDGSLVSWGKNANGQLGNGSNTNSTMPVAVSLAGTLNGKTVTALQAANAHCLALCSDGSIASWGSGSNGILGNGGITNSNVPVAVTAAAAARNSSHWPAGRAPPTAWHSLQFRFLQPPHWRLWR